MLNLAIELIVAGLLAATIGYCVLLNRQLRRLRVDGGELRRTMENLVAATNHAERALAGLKASAVQVEHGLAKRLDEADHVTGKLGEQLAQGETVLNRITQITKAMQDGRDMGRDVGLGRGPLDDEAGTVHAAPFHRAA